MKRVGRLPLAVAIAWSAQVVPHPVHEVVQNAYLTLAPGTVELELELTAGPQVVGRIVRALDPDGDRRIIPIEARAYAARVLSRSRLTVDGRPLALALRSVDVPSYPALLGAHGTIRIVATAARRDLPGPATLTYRNGYSPAESRCDANIFVRAGSRPSVRIGPQLRSPDGRTLSVRFTTFPS